MRTIWDLVLLLLPSVKRVPVLTNKLGLNPLMLVNIGTHPHADLSINRARWGIIRPFCMRANSNACAHIKRYDTPTFALHGSKRTNMCYVPRGVHGRKWKGSWSSNAYVYVSTSWVGVVNKINAAFGRVLPWNRRHSPCFLRAITTPAATSIQPACC